MRVWPVLLVTFLAACSSTPPAPVQTVAKPRIQKTRPKPVVNANKEEELAAQRRAEALLKKIHGPNVVLLDVRSPEEFVNGHVVGAKNVDFLQDNFEGEIKRLDRRKTYLLYCASGNRSGKALQYFLARGMKAEAIDPYEALKTQGAPTEGIDP